MDRIFRLGHVPKRLVTYMSVGHETVNEEKGVTHVFFPQIAPWYQFLHELKYFFLVPRICWRAQTFGLESKGKAERVNPYGEHLCCFRSGG